MISGTGATLLITNNAENALHVIISAGAVGTAELDGFTVTKAWQTLRYRDYSKYI